LNETGVIRQQLAVERDHLREILESVRRASAPATARAVCEYIDWAARRLLLQLQAHHDALAGTPDPGPGRAAELARLSGAAAQLADRAGQRPMSERAEQLQALLAAWSESLEQRAAATLRVAHWRRAAQLSADSILEERQLYAAARAAAGSAK